MFLSVIEDAGAVVVVVVAGVPPKENPPPPDGDVVGFDSSFEVAYGAEDGATQQNENPVVEGCCSCVVLKIKHRFRNVL